MSESNSLEYVIATVAEYLGVSDGSMDSDTILGDELGLSFPDLQEIAILLEEQFGPDYGDEDIESWETLGDIAAMLAERATDAGGVYGG